ncbi:MAG: lytic transglycosylase [Deltaproteobacteria bacterium]|nr:lytic transglycosylase [Deltaproteobacteria bacterium]
MNYMWLCFLISSVMAGDVWRSDAEDGTISFTDSPPSDGNFFRFSVDGPPPEVMHVNPRNFPLVNHWDALIISAARRHGVDAALVKAVVLAESGMNPDAVSRAGAQGLMQLMPPTARELGVTDSFNATQNIEGGTKYLAKLLKMFHGDRRLALAGYNAGPTRVKRIMAVPNIEETQTYVKRVLSLHRYFSTTSPLTTPEYP